ncbi:MAG: UDP-N-acetylglucosamine 4,6-dehydratase [Candidatus Aenigmatarchaeota archaeon]
MKLGLTMFILDNKFVITILKKNRKLFTSDLEKCNDFMSYVVRCSSFLVIGGAGSIGSATVKAIFKRNPKVLHVVDISENELAELVRDLRSEYGYISGEFKTFAIDVGTDIYDKFINDFGEYDYVLNFSALKHVRSEKDPYTLMRLIEVNILNTIKTIEQAIEKKSKKYFCVSTDKATKPVNMMGASKRIMELYLIKYSEFIDISTARFANVAFSNGSLLHSFINRVQKKQPIVAPDDVRRYFITPEESGMLCLLSAIFGENLDLFFPKLDPDKDMMSFWEIAKLFLNYLGYEPYICETEEEARSLAKELPEKGKWACYISKTDTTGEKEYEEFYTPTDKVDWDRFEDIGVIRMNHNINENKLEYFLREIKSFRERKEWQKSDIVKLFKYILPEFEHIEKGKYLDDKM